MGAHLANFWQTKQLFASLAKKTIIFTTLSAIKSFNANRIRIFISLKIKQSLSVLCVLKIASSAGDLYSVLKPPDVFPAK